MKSFNTKSGQSDLKKVWIPCLAKYTCSGEAYHAQAVCMWKIYEGSFRPSTSGPAVFNPNPHPKPIFKYHLKTSSP